MLLIAIPHNCHRVGQCVGAYLASAVDYRFDFACEREDIQVTEWLTAIDTSIETAAALHCIASPVSLTDLDERDAEPWTAYLPELRRAARCRARRRRRPSAAVLPASPSRYSG
ncbi:hypothetical protein AB4Y45_25565 [Paraburkholderia sp. EG287A]|uniref:hypothetical protein n=1 Tax=unclassified Paraburkholderia TaxID=2615204 RepID=UPI0034D1D298